MNNSKMIEQLEKLFDRLNKDIFGGELPPPYPHHPNNKK